MGKWLTDAAVVFVNASITEDVLNDAMIQEFNVLMCMIMLQSAISKLYQYKKERKIFFPHTK